MTKHSAASAAISAIPSNLFEQYGTTFEDYFTWLTKKNVARRTASTTASTTILEIIKKSVKPFVVIQSISSFSQLKKERESGLAATKSWLQANGKSECLVINNSGAHWDSTLIAGDKEKFIGSSSEDFACGCYTLMNILIQYRQYADKYNLVTILKKLTPAEELEIREIMDTGDNSSTLSAELVRKFTKAAIENSSATDENKKQAAKNVIKTRYQLYTEELGMALDGLGIYCVEQSYLGKIDDVNIDFLKQNAHLNIFKESGKSHQDEMQNVVEYLKTLPQSQKNPDDLLKTKEPSIIDTCISYCEILELETKKIDEVEYFSFITPNDKKFLIPTRNTENSKFYSLNNPSQTKFELKVDSNIDQVRALLSTAFDAKLKQFDDEVAKTPKQETQPKSAIALTVHTLLKNAITKMTLAESQASAIVTRSKPSEEETQAQKKVEDAIEKSLATQKTIIAPKKAYRGIGVKATISQSESGVVALKIKDIFDAESLARFFIENSKTAMNHEELKTKMTEKFIVAVGGKNINDIATECGGKTTPEFLEKIASIFHDKGDLEFEIADEIGGTTTKIKCERNIFVTNNCTDAKEKLQDKSGAHYSADMPIEALENSQEILETAQFETKNLKALSK